MKRCDVFFLPLLVYALSSLISLSGCGGGGTAPPAPAPLPNPAPAAAPTGMGGAGGSAATTPQGGAASNPTGATGAGGTAWSGGDDEALKLIGESVTVRNNLKSILLALHNHHDVYLSFLPSLDNPRAYDEQHRPRYSWRVELLPFIDQNDLYEQYNFDEPWDSEQNKAVLNQMPDVFRTPGETGSNTRIMMVVGDGAAVQPGKRDARISDFADGTSNTLLVAHAGADKAVPWTKPDDLHFGPLDVRATFGNIGDSLVFATADGAVHKIRADAPDDVLRNLVSPNDGNPIDLAALEQPDAPLPWLSAPPRSGPLATAYMPEDCFGLLVLRPKRLMNSDLFKQNVPPEVLGQAASGAPVDPQHIEEIVIWFAPPDPTGDEFGKIGGAAIRCTEPFEFPPKGMDFGGAIGPEASVEAIGPIESAVPETTVVVEPAPDNNAAVPVAEPPDVVDSVGPADAPGVAAEFPDVPPSDAMPMGPRFGGPRFNVPPDHIYRPDDRTLVIGSPFRLYKLLTGKQSPAALAERTTSADGDLVLLVDTSDGQLLQRITQAVPQDNPQAQAAMFGAALFLSPFANSNLVEINLDLSGENLLALRSQCKSPQDAQMFLQQMQGFAQMGQQGEGAPPAAGAILDQLKFSADGNTGVVALPRNDTVIKTILEGIGEAVRQGFEQGRSAGRNIRQNNNLKQIGLAYHNMYDAYQGPRPWSVPTDVDAKGKPFLSWRVYALPYLDEAGLYDKFHRDEPWDSKHNKALLDLMPDVFHFSEDGDPTQTQAVYITGPQTVFDGEINGRLEKVTDGTSNTILCLIVPTEKSVPWTQPIDAVFDPDDPLSIVRPINPDGIQVLFMDGHIATIPADIDADTFKALVTPAGGEPVAAPF